VAHRRDADLLPCDERRDQRAPLVAGARWLAPAGHRSSAREPPPLDRLDPAEPARYWPTRGGVASIDRSRARGGRSTPCSATWRADPPAPRKRDADVVEPNAAQGGDPAAWAS
jgi:hypothetical protein